MKVKDKVYVYEIRIGIKRDTVTQNKAQYTVIGANDTRLCIDDSQFTSIKLKQAYRGDIDRLFNDVIIVDWLNDSYWSCIYGKLYTATSSEKIAYKRIKNALDKHITKKYTVYCGVKPYLEKIRL